MPSKTSTRKAINGSTKVNNRSPNTDTNSPHHLTKRARRESTVSQSMMGDTGMDVGGVGVGGSIGAGGGSEASASGAYPPSTAVALGGASGSGYGGTSGYRQESVAPPDDGDNRTRNARAQRRHREKRKAMTAALEASVHTLTTQLEEARRQLGQSFRSNILAPDSRDFAQLQSENAYLRDENADLRRQLYSYRVNFGNMPPPPPVPPGPGHGGEEVKGEPGGFGGVVYGSPRGDPQRRSNDYEGHPPSGGEGASSAPSSTASYPPQVDHFNSMNHRSRRVLSTSSAPNSSPYLPSDPRSIDHRYPPVRYEPMYANQPNNTAPPPHSMPRSGSMYDTHQYVPREDGQQNHGNSNPNPQESAHWPPEQAGPPPFGGYPLEFHHEGQTEEWRSEH